MHARARERPPNGPQSLWIYKQNDQEKPVEQGPIILNVLQICQLLTTHTHTRALGHIHSAAQLCDAFICPVALLFGAHIWPFDVIPFFIDPFDRMYDQLWICFYRVFSCALLLLYLYFSIARVCTRTCALNILSQQAFLENNQETSGYLLVEEAMRCSADQIAHCDDADDKKNRIIICIA